MGTCPGFWQLYDLSNDEVSSGTCPCITLVFRRGGNHSTSCQAAVPGEPGTATLQPCSLSPNVTCATRDSVAPDHDSRDPHDRSHDFKTREKHLRLNFARAHKDWVGSEKRPSLAYVYASLQISLHSTLRTASLDRTSDARPTDSFLTLQRSSLETYDPDVYRFDQVT